MCFVKSTSEHCKQCRSVAFTSEPQIYRCVEWTSAQRENRRRHCDGVTERQSEEVWVAQCDECLQKALPKRPTSGRPPIPRRNSSRPSLHLRTSRLPRRTPRPQNPPVQPSAQDEEHASRPHLHRRETGLPNAPDELPAPTGRPSRFREELESLPSGSPTEAEATPQRHSTATAYGAQLGTRDHLNVPEDIVQSLGMADRPRSVHGLVNRVNQWVHGRKPQE